MSQSLRRPKARRALDAPSAGPLAHSAGGGEDLTVKGLLTHSLAALAISTLGLAVAGSVALTSSAQAVETSAHTTAPGDSGHTRAEPAAQAAQNADASSVPADQKADRHSDEAIKGALDVFARTADASNHNAVRVAIDGAVADQRARDRGIKLVQSDEQAASTSALVSADARSTELNNAAQANKREQARMAEEKKKADEALKKSGGQVPDAGNLAPLPVGAGGGVVGNAASPLPPGAYSVGARWGAVGPWARYHTGQDLPAPLGTPIRAAAAGVVMGNAAGAGWAGIHVVVQHSDGSQTLYAHTAGALVRPGQLVQPGQQIATVGMTGNTFGPHLHFEHYPTGTRPGDVYSTDDPYGWMLRQGVRL